MNPNEVNILNLFVTELTKSISLFKPESALVVTFLLAIIADLIFKKSKNISGYVALAGFAVTAIFLCLQCSPNDATFVKSYAVDPFAKYFKYLILLCSSVVVLMSFVSEELYKSHHRLGEYFSIIVGMTFGMFLLTGSTNLIMLYLSIEIMSISSYILAGYTKEIKRATEASLKYVIFGAVSSGLMIYGISLIYGISGTLNLFDVAAYLTTGQFNLFALFVAGLLILAGIGYKISAVPFHFWTPDVYEGSPVTITAFLSVASKAAGFAALIRFLIILFPNGVTFANSPDCFISLVDWQMLIAVLSLLSMTIGNLVAVWQTNLKRLLAYSSIAHAGYILMGVLVMDQIGIASVLIYFTMYLFMNLGAFIVVMLIADKIGSEEIDDYNGIGYRAPILGVCMAIFLVSLTGLPPTAGFIGKFYIFAAIINAGADWTWLVIAAVLNSVVSLFYYAKVFRNMYLRDVDSAKHPIQAQPFGIALAIMLVIPTLLFGIYFSPIVDWANKSVTIFLGQ